jgi:hypothetical protein
MRTEQFKNTGTPAARAVFGLFREKNFLPGGPLKNGRASRIAITTAVLKKVISPLFQYFCGFAARINHI